MTCGIIHTIALTIIGETGDVGTCEDYDARSPSILNVIFSRYARLSEMISGTGVSMDDILITSLEDEYPLDERLIPLCAESLAAMLIVDELPEVSKMLSEKADTDAETISHEVTEIGSTKEVYGS